MEVGLRGPVFEDGWLGWGRGATGVSDGDGPPRTEYGALRAWIRGWVGEKKAPKEKDTYSGIKRVREMRDGQFGKGGGHVVSGPPKEKEWDEKEPTFASAVIMKHALWNLNGVRKPLAYRPLVVLLRGSQLGSIYPNKYSIISLDSLSSMDLFSYIDRTEPNSPTFPTSNALSARFDDPPSPTPRPASSRSSEPTSRSLSDLKALGCKVYQEVWDEFYDWEPSYCTATLNAFKQWSLELPRDKVSPVARAMVMRLLDPHDHATEAAALQKPVSGTDTVTMHITSFTSGGRGHGVQWHTGGKTSGLKHATTMQDVSIPVITIDAYPPHPLYESCPPVSRNVVFRHELEHTLPFLPYADDAQFSAQAYQANFEELEWAISIDPDVELIQMEAIRRLHAVHDIEVPRDIDRMEIFKEFRHGHNTGLLWDQLQRDRLHWFGAFIFDKMGEKSLPSAYTPDPHDLRQRLMSNLAVFCPNLNCLHAVCPSHGTNVDRNRDADDEEGKPISIHVGTYIPCKKPQKTGKEMILSEGEPCGPDCFRLIQDFDMFVETLPPSPAKSHSLDTLETILDIDPDLFPCHLAIICLKPCKQIFAQRLQVFPDHTILTDDLSGDPLTGLDSGRQNRWPARKKKKKVLRFVDGGSIQCYELLDACSHSDVEQNVSDNGKVATVQIENVHLPDVIVQRMEENAFQIHRGSLGKPCLNTRMQRLASKPIEIKCGTYGLGAFACQAMDKGAYIGTYAGHILSHKATDQLIDLAKHVSLNYLFDIPPDRNHSHTLPTFNAAYLGNSTRFLNHMTREEANVDAVYKLVNGEHQIGFFTTKKVKEGEELFVDYGDNYWG
ncbi:hypothetical protein JVU11DRAFT_8698 [Chiua virens]|nr:hypothetical protein JVU11DRAFT_8698 [Chiua virens]